MRGADEDSALLRSDPEAIREMLTGAVMRGVTLVPRHGTPVRVRRAARMPAHVGSSRPADLHPDD